MSDLHTLHKSARTLILSLRDGIEQLEKLEQVSRCATIYLRHNEESGTGRHEGARLLLIDINIS